MTGSEIGMKTVIEGGTNPYRNNVQGKANEPVTVAGLIKTAEHSLSLEPTGCSLGEIYDRLESNAPRIAIIGGSSDHPAHIADRETILHAAAGIWERGGVPFHFSIPVVCDATAQNNLGMCYSLQSRNAAAAAVISQMEAHSYHGAFAVSGCDKTPLGIACGLVHLDRVRRRRGDAHVFATFCPSHVMRGGVIPPEAVTELDGIARRAEQTGNLDIAAEIRETSTHILQCISNSSFQSVLSRAEQRGLVGSDRHRWLERILAVHTCHAKGGICAFNGTGNSSRHVLSGLGLVHPAVELLVEPPDETKIEVVLDSLFTYVNAADFSAGSILEKNFANAVRIHSATGGSTNLMMHLVAAMIYAGFDVDLHSVDRIRSMPPVPDLFDYSLSAGRDIFALAQQCAAGKIRGMETVFYELVEQGIPMDLDAPTVTGTSWRERLSDIAGLPADGVKENPVVLSQPRRTESGVELLRGNFFDSAVIKISGMTDAQLTQLDDQVFFVLFFENEEQANLELLDVGILKKLSEHPSVTHKSLLAMASHNGKELDLRDLASLDKETLFDRMTETRLFKLMIVISGQGPAAFGMPEMFTPMSHINANRSLHQVSALISDGRFSGTTWGAAIGHVTPEAIRGGWIGLLETGDLLRLRYSERLVELIDPEAFSGGVVSPLNEDLGRIRRGLGEERLSRMRQRRSQIAVTNRLSDVTDAGRGVVPLVVAEEATRTYPVTRP